MSYSSSKLRSLVVASLLFGTVSVSAMVSDKPLSIPAPLGTESNTTTSAPNEVIVTFKEGVDVFSDEQKESISPMSIISDMSHNYMDGFSNDFKNELDKRFENVKFMAKGYKKLGAMHLKSESNTTEELISFFSSKVMEKYVKYVSKNNMVALSSSNDSYYSKLWAIENTAQEVNNKTGTDDADMDVAEAWVKTKGDQDVIVAVLDTGVDYRHDDLKDNMWSGLVKHGYDFAGDDDGTNDDDPMPDKPYDEKGHYHGTHVAGTIGAVGDNSKGVSGVAQKVSIMALKVFRPNGYGYSNDIMEALDYVAERVDAGDNIVAINASYGGGGGSQDDATNDAIKKLGEKGVVFCAAAGNEGKDIDAEPTYPASYNAENIITVAASDQDDALASFSNFGAKSVDVAAPGTNILSTFPDNRYAYLQGTSMATPNVAGTIALLASEYPNSTVAERKAMILDNVEKKSAFKGKMTTGGRVNINDALEDEPKNTAPIAENDTTTTDYETAVTIDVLANDSDEDGDTLTIKSVGEASNGTVEVHDGKIEYKPNSGFEGRDVFEYTLTDGKAETTAKVEVRVEAKLNSAPVAKDDTATANYNESVTIEVLKNDSDEDGDTLTIDSFTEATNGTVSKEGENLVYTPKSDYSGEDKFTYTITDGEAQATATVKIKVKEKSERI
jgi:subtilisin family serine protease